MHLAAAWGYALPWELVGGQPSERWLFTMERYLRGRSTGG